MLFFIEAPVVNLGINGQTVKTTLLDNTGRVHIIVRVLLYCNIESAVRFRKVKFPMASASYH